MNNKNSSDSSENRAAESEAKHASSEKKTSKPSYTEEMKILLESSIVNELNQKFAIVHTSGTYILVEKTETEFVLDSKASFLLLYENQPVPELAQSSKIPTKAQVWLKSPNRRTYKCIVFNPRKAGHYDEHFNIWKGFAIKPIKG